MTATPSNRKPISPTVAALPASAGERFGGRVAARHKVQDEWREMTYTEARKAIEEIALGLVDIAVKPGDRVCILADTRVEWTLTSYAISAAGAVVVPIYPTNSPHECEWVAANSGACAVVCENDGQAASDEDRQRFRAAIGLGVAVRRRRQRGEPVPEELERPFEQADKAIFERVRQLFGGHTRQAVTGAAPIAPEILEFFYASGVPVLEGWGLTETTGVGTVGTLEHFKFGTVGRALPGVELRIAEEDGEILMRGPNVSPGYWENPEATAELLVDGWLHTGDLGELDDDGYLKITGRKKDIIITAGGKNLAPANIENDLKESRFISQAVMYGDRRPYPVALITLDPEEIGPWAQEHGLPEDIGELAKNEQVLALVQQELDRANSNYAQVEQIKKFTILDHDLSVETGELTPTLKVKRNVISDRYEGVFAAMYA